MTPRPEPHKCESCGLLEDLARLDRGVGEELKMFLAHYRKTGASFKLTVEMDGHGGRLKAIWVGPRRFQVADE